MFSSGRYFVAILIWLLCYVKADAQAIEGIVFDKDSKTPVPYTTISNKRTKQVAYSDANGWYKIDGQYGDTLFFSHPAYSFSFKVVHTGIKSQWAYLEKVKHELEEVEILSDMAKFKKDSATKHTIYRKTLKDAGHKPGASFNNGFAVDGIFTSLAFWISGKGKKNRKFTETLIYHEQSRFIGMKYNPRIVSEQTSLTEEEAQRFMMEYPMPYDYARAASDLEIKMWIRTNYREWVKKPKAADSTHMMPAIKHK